VRYRVVCVGRPDGGPFAGAVATYLPRLGALTPAELVVVKAGRGSDLAARRRGEASALRGAAAGRTVALDERGRAFTTVALAEHLTALELRGESRLTLWIGGADGLDPALRDEADERWRLSDLTLAHELALALLLEQLYRVESWRAGHPYHRG
jgi:23S rRNA (pseudouridine1915-N3)-methyltransferase